MSPENKIIFRSPKPRFAELAGGNFVKRRFLRGSRIELSHAGFDVSVLLEADDDSGVHTIFRSPIDHTDEEFIFFLSRDWPFESMFHGFLKAIQLESRSLVDLGINLKGSFATSRHEVFRLFDSPKTRAAVYGQAQCMVTLGNERLFWRRKHGPQLTTRVPYVITDEGDFVSRLKTHKLLLEALVDTGLVSPRTAPLEVSA